MGDGLGIGWTRIVALAEVSQCNASVSGWNIYGGSMEINLVALHLTWTNRWSLHVPSRRRKQKSALLSTPYVQHVLMEREKVCSSWTMKDRIMAMLRSYSVVFVLRQRQAIPNSLSAMHIP